MNVNGGGVVQSTKSTGDQGESAALNYLSAHGFRILATQWRCKGGEIDIVAEKSDVVVFVEVKTRRGGQVGDALGAITPTKRKRMIAAAYEYIAAAGLNDPEWRIDAVAVTLREDGSVRIAHVENALDW